MRSLLLLAAFGLAACAQSFETPATLEPAAMAALAKRLMGTQREMDLESSLGKGFRREIVAQFYTTAMETMAWLRQARQGEEPLRSMATRQHELFVRTKLLEAGGRAPEEALAEAFATMTKTMDDRSLYQFSVALRGRAEDAERDLHATFLPLSEKRHISLDEAQGLLAAYEMKEVMARLLPKAAELMAVEESRRYLIDEKIRIRTKAGVTICATLVRPRTAKKLPTAFEFTVYANASNRSEAVHSASEGFVGLVANSRGKRESPDAVEPYEHDGVDAAAVIDWIAAQPWSDGQVGMYGGSYDGFTQWAAAKHHPKALKAIMPSVPVAPGIDTPMEGGVFKNYAYNWIPYVTNTKLLDEADYGDWNRWNGLDWGWFGSGRPYRDLPDIDGKPNPLWLRWLSHPAYDAYWRAMIPVGDEFASIATPVLTTTGYYDGCSLSAQYYFSEHTSRRPKAEHYFLIGPYDHIGGQRRSVDLLQGYRIDPAARIDIEALRYEWMRYTLCGGPRPARLKDRVNYQVMGADAWKAAPSFQAMSNGVMKRYLTPTKAGEAYQLTEGPTKGAEFRQEVDLLDHEHLQFGQPALLQDKNLDATHGFAFASAPLEAPLELSGLFGGELRFTTNKKDLDLALNLYELTAKGDYLLLSSCLARASWMLDRSTRHLLTPGAPIVLPFQSGRLASRRLAEGSRLVFLLAIPRQPRMQMNLGSGKDVSDESAADAAEPLRVTWSGESFVTLPVWKDSQP